MKEVVISSLKACSQASSKYLQKENFDLTLA